MNEIEKGAKILAAKDNLLKLIISQVGICTISKQDEMFKYLTKSIIGQQLSVLAARSINQRIDNFFSSNYNPAIFIQTDEQSLNELGISKRKISYIYDLCNKILIGELELEHLDELSNDEIISQLIKVKGIGTWTAKMFLIFVLARTNVFPLEDLTFKNQLTTLYNIQPSELDSLKQIQELWHPYESIAAWYLWQHKDSKLSSMT